MTNKLNLKCLAHERPYPTQHSVLYFVQSSSGLTYQGILKANSIYLQNPDLQGQDIFWVSAYDAGVFLAHNNLLESSNPVHEAYSNALDAWLASTLGVGASQPEYREIKRLFISHELLKAGYTISDTLFDKYC